MDMSEGKRLAAEGFEPSEEMVQYMTEDVSLKMQRSQMGSLSILAMKGFEAFRKEFVESAGEFKELPKDQCLIFMQNMYHAFEAIKDEAIKIENGMPEL